MEQEKAKLPSEDWFRAAESGDEQSILCLVASNPTLTCILDDKDGNRTALHVAAFKGHEATARVLLEHGAEVDARDEYEYTPLHLAAGKEHEATARVLLEYGGEVDARDIRGYTPLHEAAENGHKATTRVLLEHSAEVDAKDEYGCTPLHLAAFNGHEATARVLLEHGAEVNAKGEDGCTPLYTAALQGHEATARVLLEHGAKVDERDKRGCTPLYQAAENGHEAMTKVLLEHGAEADARDEFGDTPLRLAAEKGNEAMARVFLAHGAEANARGEFGDTPLCLAARNGHEGTARVLLEHGAEVGARTNNGWTPLHEASYNGHKAMARVLLEHGAEVDARDNDGCTPLHWASCSNYAVTCELLLKHGAVTDASLVSLAKERALTKVASLLVKQLGDKTEAALLEKGCFYPAFVCTVEAFLSLPNLMKHEEAYKLGYITMMPVNAVVVFFSHRWLNGSRSEGEGGGHPDRDDAFKYNAMKQAIQDDFKDATHVWVDFLCVPQEDPASQLLAINSLPFIVRQCAHFVVLHGISGMLNKEGHDEASFQVYNTRGWCRLECLSALAPLEEERQQMRKWSLNINTKTVEHQPSVFEKDLSIFNPFGNGSVFYDESDRRKIALMGYSLAKRFQNDFGIAQCAVDFFPDDLKKKYNREGSI